MDVHPTKNVSIGIDPYPHLYPTTAPFSLVPPWVPCPRWQDGAGTPGGPRRTRGADGTNVGQSSRCSRLSYPGVHFKDVHQPHQRARVLKDIHIKFRASVNIFWYRWESWLYTYFHCRLKKIIWTYLDFVSTFVSVPIYIYIYLQYIYI